MFASIACQVINPTNVWDYKHACVYNLFVKNDDSQLHRGNGQCNASSVIMTN